MPHRLDSARWSLLKSTVITFAKQTSFHGGKQILNSSSKFIRILWIIVITGTTMAAIGMCWRYIMQYMDTPTRSLISMVTTTSVPLPQIDICPFGAFSQKKADAYQLNSDHLLYINSIFATNPAIGTGPALIKNKSIEQIRKLDGQVNQKIERYKLSGIGTLALNISYTCEELFEPECFYNTKQFNCCDHITRTMQGFGICYTIKPQNQTVPGQLGALTIQTKPMNASDMFYGSSSIWSDGAIMILYDPNVGLQIPKGILIENGRLMMIALSATNYRIKADRNIYNCSPTADVEKFYKCTENCMDDELMKGYGCIIPIVPKTYQQIDKMELIGQSPLCTPLTMMTGKGQFQTISLNSLIVVCKSRCLPYCNEWEYNRILSSVKWSKELLKPWVALSNRSVDQHLKTTMTQIFNSHLRYTEVVQYSGEESLVANLGGLLGLWLGGSVLSLGQLAYTLFNLCVHLMKQKQ